MVGQASWARNGMRFLPPASSRPTGLGVGKIVCKKQSRKCDVHASSSPSSKQRDSFCLPFLEFSFLVHFFSASCASPWQAGQAGRLAAPRGFHISGIFFPRPFLLTQLCQPLAAGRLAAPRGFHISHKTSTPLLQHQSTAS